MTTRGDHLPELDGLRGLAVLAVLMFHAGLLTGGYLGVDLFFVLSGFLITRILLSDQVELGGIRLGRFYLRRVKRLGPALLVVVAFVSLAFEGVRGDGLASILYFSNWREISSGTSYLAALSGPSPLEHTWSLSVEEQVYVAWPLLLIIGFRVRRIKASTMVILLALSVTALSLVSTLINLGGSGSRLYYGTDIRVLAVMAGALVAGAEAKGWLTGRRHLALAAPLSLLPIVVMTVIVRVDSFWLHRGILVAYGVACAGLIAGLIAGQGRSLVPLLSWSPLRWIGGISYGLYLWHWPIFVLYEGLAVRLALSFVLATASYYLLERPVREMSDTGLVLAGFSTALASVLVLLSTSSPLLSSVDEITSGEVGELVVLADPAPVRSKPPIARSRIEPSLEPGATGLPAADRAPVVMVIGDSQSLYLARPVRREKLYDYLIVVGASLGCGVGPGLPTSGGVAVSVDLTGESCDSAVTRWVEMLFNYQPDVVLVHAGAWDVLDRRVDGSNVAFGTEEWDGLTRQRFADLNAVFGGDSRRLVWMSAPCYSPVGFSGGPPERSDRARIGRWNELLREAADEKGAYVLDYDEYVCGPDGDGSLIDDATFRFDGVHLSEQAAIDVWAWIDAQPDFLGDAG